ncbi:TetR/AcrR family transcriptional regulator [Alicyclobacillus fastidiosus]|uniref:TetR/AcrR family transcriptional regulator n=1 Tax=Alicyclobacillus fastidiosus TaxID=392011 RepID=UPI0023E9C23C|nr:TetR/AcrR family transcriptional regulator [Alicyclobacillus fastidiosus]GMA65996.1 TetR family transcriptional regulator [Alicyclobacillus fastidiosus]
MAKRPGLDRAIVAQAAGELADQIGFNNITLSGVADHLGVKTPSLYNHIEGLDGLRRELSLVGLNALNHRLQRAALGRSRDDALISMLQAYRTFAKERPGVYVATLHAPDPGDFQIKSASQVIIDTLLTVLEPYQLNDDEAVYVIRGFRAIGHRFASLEMAGAFGIDLEMDESYQRLIKAFLRGLDSLKQN